MLNIYLIICFVIAFIAMIIMYSTSIPTLKLSAKVIFYFFLGLAIVLLFLDPIITTPPVQDTNPSLPV
ncbi:MAG: DUF1328 domain-containing protein [Legionella sp.]|jgi:hypothetical protein